MREQEVLVYADLAGEPILAGRLFARARGNSQTASFAYNPSWFDRSDAFQIDPELQLTEGAQHSAGKMLFGAFSDSAPDHWGRRLMQRAERRRAKRAEETPRTLLEVD